MRPLETGDFLRVKIYFDPVLSSTIVRESEIISRKSVSNSRKYEMKMEDDQCMSHSLSFLLCITTTREKMMPVKSIHTYI